MIHLTSRVEKLQIVIHTNLQKMKAERLMQNQVSQYFQTGCAKNQNKFSYLQGVGHGIGVGYSVLGLWVFPAILVYPY